MGIELTTKSIGWEKICFNSFVEQGVDCDITLPDYCPDIMRVLRCTLYNSVVNSRITGDRATAEGNVKIRIVYADDKNRIFCYDYDYPFSKYAQLNQTCDNATLLCRARTEYANCRAVSKRRVDVHAVVGLRFEVISTDTQSIISDACGDGIQLKKKGIEIDCVTAVTTKCFGLSQVENVGENNAGIGKVIDVSASPVLTETRIIKGKILLKGELCMRVIYNADDKPNETCCFNCNLPFNEIAEANVTDGCRVDVALYVNNANAEPKTDNDGEYRYMNLCGEVCAKITAYSPQSVKVISDAYSTDVEVDAAYRQMEFSRLLHYCNDTVMCKQTLDVSSVGGQKLYSCVAGKPECICTFENDKMHLKGKIPVSLIMLDGDGTPVFCEREADFEYNRTLDGAGQLSCNPQLEIGGCSCKLSSDGKADFRAEICLNMNIFQTLSEKVLVSLSVPEGCAKKNKKSSLILCFTSGNESLWDIARRYDTTVEDIMRENELSTDYVENKTMLMIPVK
ncbi:MAG: DUF3794 domain-containing protein [Clostridia bacterium]|nr:DUF3794 domain-containing protein [Clostridia bacterium]